MLSPPSLKRCCATTFAETYCPQISAEALDLIDTVKSAYANLPFKGSPLVLPGGIVVVDDIWQAALEDTLEGLGDEGVDAVRAFNLEDWLVTKIDIDGTDDQKAQMRDLRASLDARDDSDVVVQNPADDDLRSFYQSDLISDHFQAQPLMEVEVYRDLNLGDDVADADSLEDDEFDGLGAHHPADDDDDAENA